MKLYILGFLVCAVLMVSHICFCFFFSSRTKETITRYFTNIFFVKMWSTSAGSGDGNSGYGKMAIEMGQKYFKSRMNSNRNSNPTSDRKSDSLQKRVMNRLPSLAKMAMGS